jgi:hypothetical protein
VKRADFEFECDCGGKTDVAMKLPEMFRPALHQVVCKKCHSQWEVRMRKHLDGRFSTVQRLVIGTRGLGEALQKKKQHELAHAPQKKAPQFFVSPERKN